MDPFRRRKIAVGLAEVLRIRDTFTDPIMVANMTTPLMENIISNIEGSEFDESTINQVVAESATGARGNQLLKKALELAKKEADKNVGH